MARGFFYIPLSASRGCVQNALQKVSFGKHCVNLMLPCPRLLAPVHARHSRGDGQRAQRPRLAETAQAIAVHEPPRTTKLYDRASDAIDLAEIERIRV